MQEKLKFEDKLKILIELFIRKGETFAWNDSDYNRERRACKLLVSKYTDFSFFYNLVAMQNQFHSLFGMLGKYWRPILDAKYKMFVEEKLKRGDIILQEKPVGEIEHVKNKPKNPLEFLDL